MSRRAELVGCVEEAHDAVPDDPPLVALDRAHEPVVEAHVGALDVAARIRLAGGLDGRAAPAGHPRLGRIDRRDGRRRTAAPRAPRRPEPGRGRGPPGPGGPHPAPAAPRRGASCRRSRTRRPSRSPSSCPTSIGRAVVVGEGRMPSTSRAAVRAPQLAVPPSAPTPLPPVPAAVGPGAAGSAVGRSATDRAVIDRARDGPGRGRIGRIRAAARAAGWIAGTSGSRGVVASPRPGGRAAGGDVGIGRLDARSGGAAADRAGRPVGRQRATRAAGVATTRSDRLAVHARRRRRRRGSRRPARVVPPGVDHGIGGGGRGIAMRGRRRGRLRCRGVGRRVGRGGRRLWRRRRIRLRCPLRRRRGSRIRLADRDGAGAEVRQELSLVRRHRTRCRVSRRAACDAQCMTTPRFQSPSPLIAWTAPSITTFTWSGGEPSWLRYSTSKVIVVDGVPVRGETSACASWVGPSVASAGATIASTSRIAAHAATRGVAAGRRFRVRRTINTRMIASAPGMSTRAETTLAGDRSGRNGTGVPPSLRRPGGIGARPLPDRTGRARKPEAGCGGMGRTAWGPDPNWSFPFPNARVTIPPVQLVAASRSLRPPISAVVVGAARRRGPPGRRPVPRLAGVRHPDGHRPRAGDPAPHARPDGDRRARLGRRPRRAAGLRVRRRLAAEPGLPRR